MKKAEGTESPQKVVLVEKKDSNTINKELAVESQDRRSLEAELYKKVPQMFSEAQRRLVLNETPRYVIKQRKGKDGMYFDYVDTGYVIEQLNLLTGYQWDFRLVTKPDADFFRLSIEIKQFIVVGEITLHSGRKVRVIQDAGRADIKQKKDGSGYLDIGNDLKSAISDCIKRCARQLGVALDVYSGAVRRAQDENHPEHPLTEGQRKRLEALANEAGIGHSGLKKIIAELFDYSSTTDIQRRHFEMIQQRVSLLVSERLAEPEMPEEIKQGFDILGTPKAKRIATYSAYKSKGAEGLKELRKKMNAELDKRITEAKNNGV